MPRRLAICIERSGPATVESSNKLSQGATSVQDKWAQAKKQLDRAESANESGWNEVQGGFKKAYGELKDSFDEMLQWLGDKVAP